MAGQDLQQCPAAMKMGSSVSASATRPPAAFESSTTAEPIGLDEPVLVTTPVTVPSWPLRERGTNRRAATVMTAKPSRIAHPHDEVELVAPDPTIIE